MCCCVCVPARECASVHCRSAYVGVILNTENWPYMFENVQVFQILAQCGSRHRRYCVPPALTSYGSQFIRPWPRADIHSNHFSSFALTNTSLYLFNCWIFYFVFVHIKSQISSFFTCVHCALVNCQMIRSCVVVVFWLLLFLNNVWMCVV